MNICFSHTTALRFWRSAYAALLAGPREPFYRADTPQRKRFSLPALLPDAPETNRLIGAENWQHARGGDIPQQVPQVGMVELSLLAPLGGAYPCHAITGAEEHRSNKSSIVNHQCTVPLPKGAAVWLSDCFAVVSPELLFVQMAETLSFVDLVKLGFELCGYYALPMDGKGRYQERKQLTNVASLAAFAERAPYVRGCRAAKVALKYVLDGSDSPMETNLAMLLTLPFARGGYNLPKPQMNGNVAAKSKTSNTPITCDLLWRESRLAVEYDGEEGHAGQAQRTRGARRNDELDDLGFTCITVTYGRLMDEADMDAIAAKVARHLGYRSRPRVEGYPQRKRDLRQALLCEEL